VRGDLFELGLESVHDVAEHCGPRRDDHGLVTLRATDDLIDGRLVGDHAVLTGGTLKDDVRRLDVDLG
jgi:hypothetical protein